MNTALREIVDRTFRAVEAFDAERMLRDYAPDAVVIDPHYPTPTMQGHAAIIDGLQWAFASMRTMGFTVTHYFEDASGERAAVEVATAHVLRVGARLNFPQVFVFETRDGLVTRLQAYEPYGPPGIGGIVLGLTRLRRRLTRHHVPKETATSPVRLKT